MKDKMLKVYALGPFYIELGTEKLQPEEWKSKKALKLFKYLLVNYGKSINSERIVDKLWPGCGFEAGKSRLYDTVYQLRQVIDDGQEESYIIKSPEGYMLNQNKNYWFDWEIFSQVWNQYDERISEKSQKEIKSEIKNLESAVELYRGEFMENNLEEWLTEYRVHYRQLLLKIIKALSILLSKIGNTEEALDYLQYGRRKDPLKKDFYLLAIKILKQEKKVSKAYSLYKKYENILEKELGIVPSQDLENIYDQLMSPDSGQDMIYNIGNENQVAENLLGAMVCKPEVFNKIYELRRRDVMRIGITCTLLEIKFNLIKEEELLAKFISEISNRLRTVDVVCRKQNTIYLLLYDALVKDSSKITERLLDSVSLQEIGSNPQLEWKQVSVSE